MPFNLNLTNHYQRSNQQSPYSHLLNDLAELMEVQSLIAVLIGVDDHLGDLAITDPFPQTGEHVLEFVEADGVGLLVGQEVAEDAFALLSGVLDALVLPLQELNELVLLQLPPAVSIDLVHEILGLLLVDLHLTGLEHLHDFALGDAAGVISVELHEDTQVLLLGASLGLVLAHTAHRKYIFELRSRNHSFQVGIHAGTVDAPLDVVVVEIALVQRGMGLVWIWLRRGHVVGGWWSGVTVVLGVIGRILRVIGGILRGQVLIGGVGVCVVDILSRHIHLCIVVVILLLHILLFVAIVPHAGDGSLEPLQPLLDTFAEDDCQHHYNQYIPNHLIISPRRAHPRNPSFLIQAESEYRHLQALLVRSGHLVELPLS